MAVGRGFQGPKYDFQSQFVELPLDFMQKQLDARGKEQEKQNALVVDMLGKKIPVHNEDIYGIEHAKQLKTNLDSQLNELAGTDFTAPGSTQKILGVKSQFNKIFSQFGDADQLTERGNTIEATKKSILDAKASDQTKAYKLAQLREGIKSSPMGTKIKAPGIVDEVDIPKLMMDTAKEVVADSREIENLRVTDPNDALTMVSSTGKTVTVSRSKLINTLDNYFKYDPAVASTVQQQAEVFSGGDPDRYKALSNLNVIGEKGRVDNRSLYGAAMEAALGAKTRNEVGQSYDYSENRLASQNYAAGLKNKESDEVLTRTEVATPEIQSKAPASTKELTAKKTEHATNIINELEKAFSITPERVPAGQTPKSMAEAYVRTSKGDLAQLKKTIVGSLDPSKTPRVLKLIQDKQNLAQLEEDADNYAKSKGADVASIRERMRAVLPDKIIAAAGNTRTDLTRNEIADALLNNRGGVPVNSNEYSLTPSPDNKDVYVLKKFGNFYGNVDGTKTIRNAVQINKELIPKMIKADEYKNEYLNKVKETTKLPGQFADNIIIPYIYDANNQLKPDLEKGQKITKAINTNLKDGLYDGLMTSEGKTLGTIIAEQNADKEGADKVKPSKIRFTSVPNNDGVQEILINVGNKEVRIPSDKLQINNPSGSGMIKLSDLQNTPLDKINRTIFSAYSTGLNKIKLEGGITIDLPEFNKAGVKDGGYVNESNIVVTVSPEDKEKFDDLKQDKIVGQKAINYLIYKINNKQIIL